MKCIFLFILVSILSSTSKAQGTVKDSIALKALVKSEESAWNKHDWNDFTSRFTDDGTLINFIGSFWKDKKDILAHFTQFNALLITTSLSFLVDRIRFLSSEFAIVYVKEIIVVTEDNDGPLQKNKKGDKEYKMLSLVCKKNDGNWKITSMQVSPINQIIFHELQND